jgi:rfaE bifunctional protein nucleotidyltransferase chain/domain
MSCSAHAVTVHADTAARLRAALPAPLVFTNGVFDLLHAGHVHCLEQARALGRSLVVGVNGDASARRLRKGPGRPLVPAAERARVVAALKAVSAVVVFDEDKPLALLCALQPEVYVKGGDYDVASLCEARLMDEWGGRTVIVPRVEGLSTTALVERMRPPTIDTARWA